MSAASQCSAFEIEMVELLTLVTDSLDGPATGVASSRVHLEDGLVGSDGSGRGRLRRSGDGDRWLFSRLLGVGRRRVDDRHGTRASDAREDVLTVVEVVASG